MRYGIRFLSQNLMRFKIAPAIQNRVCDFKCNKEKQLNIDQRSAFIRRICGTLMITVSAVNSEYTDRNFFEV